MSPLFAREDHVHPTTGVAALDSAGDPQPIASAGGDRGTGTEASREDHIHPHGNLIGDTLHAVAVAAGAAGFMSGADKTIVDAALIDGDFSGSTSGYLRRTGAGAYAAIKDNEAAAAPATTDNTAAGYDMGSEWRDTQSGVVWQKVGEQGGSAQWARAAQNTARSTLADNQASATNVHVAALTWGLSSTYGVILEYAIYRGTANSRMGRLHIVMQDNTDTATFTDVSMTEVGSSGVTLSLSVAAGSATLQYTSTSTGTAPRFEWIVIREFRP